MRSLKRRSGKCLIGLILALVCAALPVSCGKKAPPRLPDRDVAAGVRNLTATLEGGDIVLRWTAMADKDAQGAGGYFVYRSADPVTEDVCDGCPVLFRRVAEVPMAAPAQEGRRMTYREAPMPGTRYRFKVVPYDEQKRIGPDSNIVGITTD
jgi:hypothetical protein